MVDILSSKINTLEMNPEFEPQWQEKNQILQMKAPVNSLLPLLYVFRPAFILHTHTLQRYGVFQFLDCGLEAEQSSTEAKGNEIAEQSG